MFRDKLKLLRRKHNLTQSEVARRINVERSSIAKYESQQSVIPSADVVLRLADLFNVSTDYLLDRNILSEKQGFEESLVMLSFNGERTLRKIPREKMPVLLEIVKALAENE